ncbi:MAG: hypothetical protein WD734_02485 [Dehalococcoidia bacterium]
MRSLTNVVVLVIYLGIGVFPYAASTLVAPPLAVVALMVAWALGLGATVLLIRRGSRWALASPPLALLFWVVYLTLGERLLGWTA